MMFSNILSVIAYIFVAALIIFIVSAVLNHLSYQLLKKRILDRRKWDLNICCGHTDGGGINADIVIHRKISRMTLVDIYNLPFKDGQFEHILCSHTIEHIDDPNRFYNELQRIGQHITVVIPPLWDISAVINLLEHRWIFLSWKKEHKILPNYMRLPLARYIQQFIGQKISA